MANLADLLTSAAERFGSRTALTLEDARVSWADVAEAARRFAGTLHARGVAPGDRVGLLLPNTPAVVAAYYGALAAGAIVVPLNPLLRKPEIVARLDDAGASVLVVDADRAGELAGAGVPLLDPAAAAAGPPDPTVAHRDPDDVAVLLYTSGTSGSAKGAELTHAGLREKAEFVAREVLELTPEDVLFGSTPLTHILGMSGVMNPAALAGASIVLVPRFEAESALATMRAENVGVLLCVPTMCVALLRAAEELAEPPRLRVAHVGGAALAPETLQAFGARFGCTMLEGYGMTELSGTVTAHRPGRPIKPGSVGIPVDGVDVRVVDRDGTELAAGEIGEVLARGSGQMLGYWRNETETAAAFVQDGWLATGDMGYLDDDGYLYLVDRKKDVILRGGYTVYPREIEDVLHDHPAVLEAAVVGVPDELLGEEVVALVVPRPGVELPADEVRAFVRERVAAYKYPRVVVAVDALPRGPTGKILKREIDRAALQPEVAAAHAAR